MKFIRQKIILILFITAVLFGAAAVSAAADKGTHPTAFTHKVQPIELVEQFVTEPIDIQAVQLEDELWEQEGGPYRFAIPRRVVITPDANGMWEEIDNETWLWRIHITSPGATSISLGFTHYLMPSGGELFIYSVDGKEVLGPYTERDNALHEQLWTPLIHSDDVMVELTIPVDDVANLELTLGSINHGYRRMLSSLSMVKGLGDSDWCERNVACTEGDNWRDQIRSVALYYVTLADGTWQCTGTLINNTAQDEKPYFLTAFHCFDEYLDGVLDNPTGAAATMVVYWNFQASTCFGTTGPTNQDQTGAYFRAAYCHSDLTLVELDEMPPCEFNVYYAGWDRGSSAPSSGVAIHHPMGDIKKISIENHALTLADWFDMLPCAIEDDLTHLKASHWEVGGAETASSGCPFFNPNKRVVGQLSSGTSDCYGGYDKFGRFYRSWTGGGTSSTRLRNWLDPIGSGVTYLNGRENTCSPPCSPPTVSASDGTYTSYVRITWNSVSSPCNYYRVYRATTQSGSYSEIGTTNKNDTDYDDNCGCGKTYWYRVTAYNTGGESGYSNSNQGNSQSCPVFDTGSADFSNIPFVHAKPGDLRTYNGQGDYAGTGYTQTASSELFLGVNCLRIDETGVSGHDKKSLLIFIAKDASGTCWLFKFVEDGYVWFEATDLSEVIRFSEVLNMRARLAAGNYGVGTTVTTLSGATQEVISTTATLPQFPGHEFVLVQWTSADSMDVDWEYYQEPFGLVLDIWEDSGDTAGDGWLLTVPFIYVDGVNGNDQQGDGSMANPYKTVQKAIQVASDGDTIIILAGNYPENITFNKRLRIEAQGGLVRIGQ